MQEPDSQISTSYHHGGLRDALIAAGLDILNEENVMGLSLRKVAKRANVSHAAPYRHFKDKQHLLAGIAEEGFRALAQGMTAVLDAYGDNPRQAILQMGHHYIAFGVAHPAQLSLMFSDLLGWGESESLGEAAGETFELVVRMITLAQTAGVVKQGDPEQLARAHWAMAHGLAMLAKEGFLSGEDGEYDQQKSTQALENLLVGMEE